METNIEHDPADCPAELPKNFTHVSGLKRKEMAWFWRLCERLNYPYIYIQILPERDNGSIEWMPVMIVVDPSRHGSPATLIELTLLLTGGNISLEKAESKYLKEHKQFKEFARHHNCPQCRYEDGWNIEENAIRQVLCSVDLKYLKFADEKD